MNGERQSELLPIPEIHTFAVKWLDKFKDPDATGKEFYDIQMGHECNSLGFELDGGNAFSRKYGVVCGDPQAMKKVIDDVDDIMLLGSAIFSLWRYFNHWSEPDEDILDLENREWFILALDRMKELSEDAEDGSPHSIGKIQRIKICSNSVGMIRPKPDDEVEQHLTITRDGRVFFSSYVFWEGFGQHKRVAAKNFRINADKAERIMTALEEGFSKADFGWFVTDIGDWTAEIVNKAGYKFNFQYSLSGGVRTKDGTSVSDIIREELNMPELYVFDHNCKTE